MRVPLFCLEVVVAVRRASRNITLVLMGSAALGACGPSVAPAYQRDLYTSVQDCAADWGRPESCEPASGSVGGGTGGSGGGGGGYHYRGPYYSTNYRDDAQRAERERARSEGHLVSDTAPSDRSVARLGPGGTHVEASGTTRRGFGTSSRSFSSFGG